MSKNRTHKQCPKMGHFIVIDWAWLAVITRELPTCPTPPEDDGHAGSKFCEIDAVGSHAVNLTKITAMSILVFGEAAP